MENIMRASLRKDKRRTQRTDRGETSPNLGRQTTTPEKVMLHVLLGCKWQRQTVALLF